MRKAYALIGDRIRYVCRPWLEVGDQAERRDLVGLTNALAPSEVLEHRRLTRVCLCLRDLPRRRQVVLMRQVRLEERVVNRLVRESISRLLALRLPVLLALLRLSPLGHRSQAIR